MSTLFGSIYDGSESKIDCAIGQFSDRERLVALAQIYLRFSLPRRLRLGRLRQTSVILMRRNLIQLERPLPENILSRKHFASRFKIRPDGAGLDLLDRTAIVQRAYMTIRYRRAK